MSTRTDWGIFDAAGLPVAVGDAWARWKCPKQQWVYNATEVHIFTGELVPIDPYPVECPYESQTPKLDVCSRCGNRFIYP